MNSWTVLAILIILIAVIFALSLYFAPDPIQGSDE